MGMNELTKSELNELAKWALSNKQFHPKRIAAKATEIGRKRSKDFAQLSEKWAEAFKENHRKMREYSLTSQQEGELLQLIEKKATRGEYASYPMLKKLGNQIRKKHLPLAPKCNKKWAMELVKKYPMIQKKFWDLDKKQKATLAVWMQSLPELMNNDSKIIEKANSMVKERIPEFGGFSIEWLHHFKQHLASGKIKIDNRFVKSTNFFLLWNISKHAGILVRYKWKTKKKK